MIMNEYFCNMKNVLQKIEKSQAEKINETAIKISDQLAKGFAWHILDTGHMLMHESIGRTGGLVAVKPVMVTCEINNPVRQRDIPYRGLVGYDSVPGFADFVIGRSQMISGDVLMIGSVSGYKYFPVDLAIKARDSGLVTIALTSVEYSKNLASLHPSKKRLFEACELVLDHCSNMGDTTVWIESLNQGICPSSGIGAAYIMWALQASVVEKLIEQGLEPSIYISNHMPGASEHNKNAISNYLEKGY